MDSGVRRADVRDAVRGEDDPVDALVAELLTGHLVAQAQPGLGVRRALRLEGVDRVEDRAGVAGGGGFEEDPRLRPVDDDADRVVASQALHEETEGLLDEPEAVLAGHRARDVDDERERRIGTRPIGDLARLEPDPEQHLVLGQERAGAAVDVDRERVVLGRGVALVEVVDEFLDPDTRRVGQVAVADVAPGDGVGGRVDVEGERRFPVLVGVDERVDPRILVGDAVVWRGRRLFRRRQRGLVVLWRRDVVRVVRRTG